MAISNVALTNTFQEWQAVTNQTVVAVNDLTGQGTTIRNLTLGLVNANSVLIGTVNVGSTLGTTFDKANSANVQATSAYARANVANTTANTSLLYANLAFDKANSANITADAAFGRANVANTTANLALSAAQGAFAQANTDLVYANLAFDKANSAVLKTGNTLTGSLIFNTGNVQFTGVNTGVYFGSANSCYVVSPSANVISFFTSSVERLRIEANGDIFITGNVRTGTIVGGSY